MTSPKRWHWLNRTLHWLMAFAIIAMLVMGVVMVDLADGPVKLKLYALHKSIGFTLLILVIARLLTRLAIDRPPEAKAANGFEKVAATTAHIGLYLLMLAMPLSGWLLNSAANFPLNWFGWIAVPSISSPDEMEKLFYRDVHEIVAWVLCGLIGLHLLAALQHRWLKKDQVLQAMLPSGAGALLLGFLLLASVYAGYRYIAPSSDSQTASPETSLAANVSPGNGSQEGFQPSAAAVSQGIRWEVSTDSALSFTGTYDDVEFIGKFPFTADIRFDPNQPELGAIEVEIDVTRVDSQSRDRDEALAEAEWFDFPRYPTARFTANNFRAIGDNTFQADARLSIRDITRKLSYRLRWDEVSAEQATLTSATELNRLDYDIGTGIWVDEIVGHTVWVNTKLNLSKP